MRRVLVFFLLAPGIIWAQAAHSQLAANQSGNQPASALTTTLNSPCAYPDWALKADIDGRTFVAYRIAPDGDITDVEILKSSGNAKLDASATQCLGHWRSDRSLVASDGLTRIWIVWKLHGSSDGPPGGYRYAPMGTSPRPIGVHDCSSWYPPEELKAKTSGRVRIRLHVALDGRVSNVTVVQSSGNSDLDQASVACVQTWQYEPGTGKIEGLPMALDTEALVDWKVD